MKPIYLDYNATTPVDPEVSAEMIPYLTELFGNPSSAHQYGIQTRMAVEKARHQVAEMLNCNADEIVFTSGGTESNNMAIKGSVLANKERGRHIIISAIEHPAVSEVVDNLKQSGFDVSIAPVDSTGRVDVEVIRSLIKHDTILISVMHANNEIGTIQPIKEIAGIAHQYGILVHSDAAQSVGKIPVDVTDMEVDLLSIAGHKLYAPKGVGALFIKRGVKLSKIMHGANHENDLRAGTENVPYIVALGKACDLVCRNLSKYAVNMLKTRDMLADGLSQCFPDLRINGNPDFCLPNTLNISFKEIGALSIINHLDQVAVSAGAACHSSGGTSGTLEALNLPSEYSYGALRLSTGRYTTKIEIEQSIELITKAVQLARNGSKMEGSEFKITRFDAGMGCGCKMKPSDLEYILKDIPVTLPQEVMVATDTRDDAAVWRINDNEAIVQTVDFFTPMVDDPYAFGAIAAANALSDIYAMGAQPIFALNLVTFPVENLPLDILKKIMSGASDKATEAGIPILGGHSIMDTGIKFGMVVTGKVAPKDLIRNTGAKKGDVLILTKALGTGIITKALSKGFIKNDDEAVAECVTSMMKLNKAAADAMAGYQVSACTDITGFGLCGHLFEMMTASKTDAEIYFDKIPFLPMAEDFASMGIIPGSAVSNEDFISKSTDFGSLKAFQRALLCDAQTSGGLLISINPDSAELLLLELQKRNVNAAIIGQVINNGEGFITCRY